LSITKQASGGAHTIQSIWFSCSLKTDIIESCCYYIEFLASFNLFRFQTKIDSSFDADAKSVPFILTATFLIQSECAGIVYWQNPLLESQIFIVLSLEHDTIWSPPGRYSTQETSCSWPYKVL
jgi:hypothetical protein